MGTKSERRAAREKVAAYHEARLAELVERVDEVIHQYHRATRKLWTFCELSGSRAEITAHAIELMADEGETIDWWERGASRRHR
ncbi:hypothetical protein [Amycolatopsis eburnea]|uniref:Uncharacterized protein n=1 Tax=Amycolatopsis eburnea TaxID=2267691 RepID=A0A427T2W6_9PSEU|nr:hypothetical protein [Amycolatopsis eburnea]RSD13133.1 hypothetical protein EIY87_25555 [Amycolatopsis eburnea]